MIRWPVAPAAAVTLALGPASALPAQDYSWPREIPASQGTIVLYQPQLEALTGNQLTARAAISYRPATGTDPVFGAMWLSGTVDTDREAGEVVIYDVKVQRVRWPDATPERQQQFTKIVNADFPTGGFRMSLERLQASLASAAAERGHVEGLKSDAPMIVFVEQVSVLLLYDGEPQTQPIENTNLEVVVNTPFGVIRDKATGTYYLGGGKIWYSAADPKGPWQAGAQPPQEILQGVSPDTSSTPPPNPPPQIVTATEPTELVVTQGPPKWQSTAEGKLLYVQNTETPWLREAEGRDNYLLISGRWFRGASLQGPWASVRPDSLPAVFQEIPPSSPIGGVRSSIALTVEAQDAILDLEIPQTSAIKRSEAKLTVTYDGEPKFVDIPNTKVAYAQNTASQVLRIEGAYYACDNAVWFRAQSPTGPWVIADSIPKDAIKEIPPSAPVYHVTYGNVYGSTSEVVYVGYTPGYVGTYPYYGVPVYGTGWAYPPYMGGVYYPRPVTYGMHVSYNPYTGWSMGMSWSTGFFTFGVTFGGGYPGYPYRGGYYPPGGYRGGGCFNCTINIGNSVGTGRGGGAARPGTRPANTNLYNRPENRARVADRGTREAASRQMRADRTARGANNVFADQNGNVHRRTSNGWESRQANAWNPDRSGGTMGGNRGGGGAGAGARPSAGTRPSYNPSHGMERAWQARQRASSRSYGGGGGRGGGHARGRRPAALAQRVPTTKRTVSVRQDGCATCHASASTAISRWAPGATLSNVNPVWARPR